MQTSARLVIIGAGIVGCGVAYFLSKRGWRDIVVVEQGPLFETGGSTTHAPGLVFQINPSRAMAEFARQTVELYSSLELDGEPCWTPVGSLEVAWTPERLLDLRRKAGVGRTWGIDAEVIDTRECLQKIPFLSDRILGAMWTPTDGLTKATKACEAMSRESGRNGVSFHGHTTVTGIEVRRGAVRAVETDRGRIETEMVLAAAGIWGPRIGRMVGVSIPLHPMQHLLAWTAPLAELKGETAEATHPILRHQDEAMYFRQRGEGYAIGSYQHEPLLVDADDILAHHEAPRMPSIVPWTPEHFERALEVTAEVMPTLRDAELVDGYNGMFSFTPDAFPVLGESPEVRGFWSAQAVWITHAGGVARTMAEWMDTGYPSLDMREADIARFHPHARSRPYVRVRAAQQYREVYDIKHPLEQVEEPRGLRLTPFHSRQRELGARLFESAGWERPQWYESNAGLPLPDFPPRSGWEAREWSPIVAAEHLAVRERAGLFDLTPFAKLEFSGPGALAYLQRLAANRIDRPVGRTVYTSMLNERGGIRCDLTVTRLARDRFLVVTSGATVPLDLHWMRRFLPKDGSVAMTDLSSSRCCLGLWGPRAREVLQRVTTSDLSNAAFPYMTARAIEIHEVPALAVRISYVGELGWELYAPAEFGPRMWDLIREAGEPYGLVPAGGGAFESLRLEKGYRLWGADIHTEYNPLEAGLDFAVRLDSGDFIGRPALIRAREEGVSRRLSCLLFDDRTHLVMGKEPVLKGDRRIGYVTSAGFGYTVGRSIAYAYLPTEHAEVGTGVEVEYFGRRYPATVSGEPLYDPGMTRLKS